MKRKIYQQLLDWKHNRHGEVALLVEGARRIGKSYIVEEFAKNEYDSYLLIDFSRVNPKVKEFFDYYLDDLDMLFTSLQVYGKKKLTPRQNPSDEASSLIIFDEIQFCPRARAAIKHLVADRRFDYIETGSLISIKKNVKDIMLPSEEHAIEMYPMDFEEFLWAMGDEVLMPFIKAQFEKLRPMDAFHRKALDYFRQYMIVGGMPQAVQAYVDTRDFDKVDERMEIDFLISKPTITSRHNISPIEVKSGSGYTITSLRKCIKKYGRQLATPYVLHDKDLKVEDGITYLPLYMTPLL